MQDITRIVALHKNESLLFKLRQSYLSSVSPDTVVLTDKRVVIIHNSFFGLYFGFNIFSPTRVSTVMLSNIMGTTTTRGKILATVNIRVRGSSGESESPESGWHIDGLRHKNAMKITEMIEELVEVEEEGVVKELGSLDFTEAKAHLAKPGTSLVWLGVEPPDYVAYMLGIDPLKIVRVNPADVFSMSAEGLKEMVGDIFACYNGHISTEIVGILRKEYNIEAFALKGGLMGLINAGIRGKG